MSLTDKNTQQSDRYSGHISSPTKIAIAAIIFLLVVGGIMYYIDINTNELRSGKSRVDTTESVTSRIQPVARFALKEVEEGDAELKTGKEVYEATCTTCHATGVADAPVFGDEADWAPHIEAGYEEMLNVALNGKGAMPAKGGNSALDDIEVERAMVYMANAAGAGFDEPGEDGDSSTDAADETDTADEKADEADSSDSDETASSSDFPDATEEQLANGKAIYDSACMACHATGVAEAPVIGDQDDWAPYIETGLDTMLQIAISGKGAMPPRGTANDASDDDLRDAILYMTEGAH